MKPHSFEPHAQAIERLKRQPVKRDQEIILHLVKRLDGRRPHRSRSATARRLRVKTYRDPLDVVARYLRRFTQGPWHRGGHHIARLHGGPGIGFRNFRNDRRIQLKPVTVHF